MCFDTCLSQRPHVQTRRVPIEAPEATPTRLQQNGCQDGERLRTAKRAMEANCTRLVAVPMAGVRGGKVASLTPQVARATGLPNRQAQLNALLHLHLHVHILCLHGMKTPHRKDVDGDSRAQGTPPPCCQPAPQPRAVIGCSAARPHGHGSDYVCKAGSAVTGAKTMAWRGGWMGVESEHVGMQAAVSVWAMERCTHGRSASYSSTQRRDADGVQEGTTGRPSCGGGCVVQMRHGPTGRGSTAANGRTGRWLAR